MGVFGGGVFGAGVFGAGSALTLTVQDTYPERVLVSATGLAEGNVVTLSRKPAGSATRTAIRSGTEVSIDGGVTILNLVDAEAPMGVELTYYLTVDGVDLDSATTTLEMAGGNVALSDAITGDAAEVVILAWPTKRRQRASSVFAVGGRNVVVSGARGGFSGTIDLYTETDDQKNNLFSLLENATSGILQLRCPSPNYDGVDCYIAVLSDDETRWSQDGTDQRRIITLDVVETQPWAASLASPNATLQDIADAYVGGTLADIADDYDSLLELALGDFS